MGIFKKVKESNQTEPLSTVFTKISDNRTAFIWKRGFGQDVLLNLLIVCAVV